MKIELIKQQPTAITVGRPKHPLRKVQDRAYAIPKPGPRAADVSRSNFGLDRGTKDSPVATARPVMLSAARPQEDQETSKIKTGSPALVVKVKRCIIEPCPCPCRWHSGLVAADKKKLKADGKPTHPKKPIPAR
jgi:hypothetical protein